MNLEYTLTTKTHNHRNDRTMLTLRQHFSKFVALMFLLTLPFTACAPASTPSPTSPPTPTRTPIRLGPTSTTSPEPPTAIPASPTATFVPIPAITDEDWTRGPQDALVTILIYTDFQ